MGAKAGSRLGSAALVVLAISLLALSLPASLAQNPAGGIATRDDATEGRSIVSEPWPAPASGMSTVDYDIDATLASNHRDLVATARVRITSRARVPVHDVWWHLYLNGFRGASTLFMRSGGGEGHRGNVPGEAGRIDIESIRLIPSRVELHADHPARTNERLDPTEMHLALPEPLLPGATLEFEVRFRARLPRVFARTGAVDDFAFVAQWFPKPAVLEPDGTWAHFPFHSNSEFYADFGRYRVSVVVPEGDIVGATGEPQGAPQRVAGGVRHTFEASRVHDFAFTCWSRFQRTERHIGGVAVRVLHPPGTSRVAERTIHALETAIPSFARRFGPYPYPGLTVVVPPGFARGAGGMEYPTLISTGGSIFEPAGAHETDYVTIHEYGHQYFYGLLASNEHRYPFLDEGLTEYATGRVAEDLMHGRAAVIDTRWARLDYWAMEGIGASFRPSSRPVSLPASAYPDFRTYATHAYSRTAAIMRTFENVFGRSTIDASLRAYALTYRFRHPVPDDLLSSFARHAPREAVDGFLRPALTDDPTFDASIVAIQSAPASAAVTLGSGAIRSRIVLLRRGIPSLPVDVAFEFADGGSVRATWRPGESRSTWIVAGDAPVVSARIDPDHRIVLDANRLNDALRARPRHVGATIAPRLASWFSMLIRGLGP